VVVIWEHPRQTRAIKSKETCTFENTVSAKSKRLSVVKLNHMEAKLQASSPRVLLTIWNVEWVDSDKTEMMISTIPSACPQWLLRGKGICLEISSFHFPPRGLGNCEHWRVLVDLYFLAGENHMDFVFHAQESSVCQAMKRIVT
jgi:hypothetical protein